MVDPVRDRPSEGSATSTLGRSVSNGVEGDTKTTHTVEVGKSYYEKLTGRKVAPHELVRRSFEFLLQREPKESILKEFNITKIAYYFPEYEEEIKRTLINSDEKTDKHR